MTFTQVGLHESLLEGLGYAGFESPTPIQQEAIPAVLTGRDLIACAQTGTGKTGAFVLPILDYIARNPDKKDGVIALIITPTRELALQIEMQIQGLGYFTNANSAAVYGGGSGSEFSKEKEAFSNGTQIIVATPGKLMAHMKMGYVDFSKLKFLILDEADRMLDMGFIDDIEKIIDACPKERQSLLFSATMAPKLRRLAIKMLHENPHEINLSISKPAEGVTQRAFLTHDNQKLPLIDAILEEKKRDSILVFCSRKSKVSEVVRLLNKRGYAAEGISSDLEQKEREDLLLKFRARQLKVLVATDVLSRGIDIQGIELVINFDVPNHPEDYVHRVGRTARAATEGEAITLINPADMRKFQSIEALIERELEKETPPAELGEAPGWSPGSSQNGGQRNKRKPQQKNRRKPQGNTELAAKSADAAPSDEKTTVDNNKRPIKPSRHKLKAEAASKATAETPTAANLEVANTAADATPPEAKPKPKRRKPSRRKKPASTDVSATPVEGKAAANTDAAPQADRPKKRPQRRRPNGEATSTPSGERPKRPMRRRSQPQKDTSTSSGSTSSTSNRSSNPYANKSTPDANKGRKANNNRGASKSQKIASAEPKGIKGFFKKLFGR
jgi:superfamily II DNA/RNA helicase